METYKNMYIDFVKRACHCWFNLISYLSTAFFWVFSQVCPPYRSSPLSPLGPVWLALPFQRAGEGIHPVQGGENRDSKKKNLIDSDL